MDARTATLLLYLITAAGVVVWFFALRSLNAAYRSRRAAREAASERFELDGPVPENLVYGSVEVEGEPAALSVKAAALLAKQTAAFIGPLRIVHRSDERVVFEGSGPDAGGPQGGAWVRRGQLLLSPAGSRLTRIHYAVELTGGRGLLLVGAAFLILGVVGLVVGFLLISTFVVGNEDPSVRGQTLQMLQAGHLLWPPFLFAALYRRKYASVRASFETWMTNLPYHDV